MTNVANEQNLVVVGGATPAKTPLALPATQEEESQKEILRRVFAAARLLPKSKAEQYRAVILDMPQKARYVIGMVNHKDLDAQEEIARVLRSSTRAIKFVRLDLMHYDIYFRHAYENEKAQQDEAEHASRTTTDWLESNAGNSEQATNDNFASATVEAVRTIIDLTNVEEITRNLGRNLNELSTNELKRNLLFDFMRSGGSDLHVQPTQNGGRIRVRTDGIPFERLRNIPVSRYVEMCHSITTDAGLDMNELYFDTLNGTIRVKWLKNGTPTFTDLRFASAPAAPWPAIVLRSQSQIIDDLRLVGLYEEQLEALSEAYMQPQGIILITGPTGSGKTNTLEGVFTELQRNDNLTIYEIADPIEIKSDKRVQIPISKKVTWLKAFHACLRMDPDVIAVGELRAVETVKVALDASLTGHLVLSTYHTTDIEKTFTRLFEMGISREQLANGLNAVHSQRLARVLCNCKEVDEQQSEAFGTTVYKPKGCPTCFGLGYKGRTAIAEVLLMREEIKSWIRAGLDPKEIVQTSIQRGWLMPMYHVGRLKVRAGITSMTEIGRVMKLEDVEAVSWDTHWASRDHSNDYSSREAENFRASTYTANGGSRNDEVDESEKDYVDADYEDLK